MFDMFATILSYFEATFISSNEKNMEVFITNENDQKTQNYLGIAFETERYKKNNALNKLKIKT